MKKKAELNKDAIGADGGICGTILNLGGVVLWEPGEDLILLDGMFTPETLRAVADYVDKANQAKDNASGTKK